MVYEKEMTPQTSHMSLQKAPRPAVLDVPLIYGCMNICGKPKAPKEAPHESIIAAFEAGFRTFDHADIYRGGQCESAHARAIAECPELAKAGRTISKAGHIFPPSQAPYPHHYNTEPGHLIESAKASRDRLGVETIDLFLIHRFDPLLDPFEVGDAFLQLQEEKVVRDFGVSNYLPWQLEALRIHMPVSIAGNQIQFHPAHLDPVFDGTLDHALAHGIVPMTWASIGKGMFATGGEVPQDHAERERYLRIQAALDEVGEREGRTRTQVTLAWLRRHPSRPVPVVGTTNPERIAESWGAADFELSRIDWFRILIASRGARMP